MDCGSNFQSAITESWGVQSGLWGVQSQVNWGATAGATFQIAQVMLHEGSEALDSYVYAGGNVITELELCQRYFEKSYNIYNYPGDPASQGQLLYTSSGTASVQVSFPYKTRKRIIPTTTIYNPSTGTAGKMKREFGVDVLASIWSNSDNSFVPSVDSGRVDNSRYNFHYTANAEFYS
jgi:hypothetical protein